MKQVDKIVDQLMQYVYNYDLTSLRELWGHLDTKMFCRLESHFTPAIRKLENAVLKMYLVNAAVNGKQDRIQEFFTKMAPELQGHSEWKEWFGTYFVYFPYLQRCKYMRQVLINIFYALQHSPLSKILKTIWLILCILVSSGMILCWYLYIIS